MPRFQLPIAVVLVLSALASIVVFYLTPNDEVATRAKLNCYTLCERSVVILQYTSS